LSDQPAGFSQEALLGYLRTTSGSGLTQLYRHYNATSGDYLLNTSVTPPSGYVMQANLGYIFTNDISGSGVHQDLVYNYDNSGNITSIDDYAFSASRVFSYDALNRLTQAVGFFGQNQALVTHDYSYNAIGNILTKGGVAFTYGDVMHPSAVTSISSGKTYTYDANGNMLTGGNRTFVWNIDNRVNSVAVGGATTSMYYDYSGARVRKDSSGIALYPFQGYEIDANGVITKFIRVGGESIAANKGTSKYFYHNDHLGSVNVVTDINGTRVQLNEYDPWGAVSRSEGSIDPDQRFTGQKLDPETGLYYYGGRYYDAEIGRFISADPFVQTIFDPQNLNRYSYVINNPQNYTDPSGYFHQLVKKKKHGGFFSSIFGSIFRIFLDVLFLAAGVPPGWDFPSVLGSAVAIGDLGHASSNLMRGSDSPGGGSGGGGGPQIPGLTNVGGGGFFSPALRLAMDTGCDVCSDVGDLLRLLSGLWQTGNAEAASSVYKPRQVDGGGGRAPGGAGGGGLRGGLGRNSGGTGGNDIPKFIYREGNTNPGNLKTRPGETYVSFRDSLSNPIPRDGRPVFRPGENYLVIDISKLPPDSVFRVGDMPGHIGVRNVPPEVLKDAVVARGTFPK
jgi:RHS repeat-associated protein